MKGLMERIIKNPAFAGFLFVLVFALGGPNAYAATTPSLGAAASYGLLSTTYVDPVTATASTINGDVGYTIAPAQAPVWVGTNYGAGAPYATAGADQGTALTAVNGVGQGCVVIAGALNAVTIGANPPGVFPPGCYEMAAAMVITLSTSVTLDLTAPGGVGNTWIFKSTGGGLTTGADSFITLANGASACNVFWAPVGATTIGAYTGALPNLTKLFIGTIIDDASISLGANSSLLGRALSFASSVTLGDNATINVPAGCTTPPVGSGRTSKATINVVKTVINDNGGTKKVSDFPLFVNGTPAVSGVINSYPFDAYWITETKDSNYTQTFSGDCDKNGSFSAYPGADYICIVTNNDIGAPVVVPPVPPLIDVVKVPSPLALPGGPGKVDYTYTLTNVGTVPVTDITMVGDTCSPIVLASGDTNSNGKLEVTETWKYTCSWNLTETHTNTVTATGWANGISTVDVASATVIVGKSTVHPLIHVTKIPSPFTLPVEGGMVTYTKKVTNPGTVALSNVTLTDDKCASVKFVSGDTNSNSKLEPTETWTYTCKASIKSTTTNTVIAKGEANGFTVRDFAVATVVVATAVPKLPNTGVLPMENAIWPVIALGILAASILLYAILRKKIV